MKIIILLPAVAASFALAASNANFLAQVNNNLNNPCALLTATALGQGWSPNNSKPDIRFVIGTRADKMQPILL